MKYPRKGFKHLKEINRFLLKHEVADSRLSSVDVYTANKVAQRLTEHYTGQLRCIPRRYKVSIRQSRCAGVEYGHAYFMKAGCCDDGYTPYLLVNKELTEKFVDKHHAKSKTYIEQRGLPYNAEGWLPKEHIVSGIVDHEIAHIIWYCRKIPSYKKDAWKQIWKRNFKDSVCFVSRYAMKNHQEGFADSFMLYMNDQSNRLPDEVVSFFDTIVK